jgi:hypothetical protein
LRAISSPVAPACAPHLPATCEILAATPRDSTRREPRRRDAPPSWPRPILSRRANESQYSCRSRTGASIPFPIRNLERFSNLDLRRLRHGAQSGHHIPQAGTRGLNHYRAAVTRNREIDVHVLVGEFSGDTDGLAVAGFESASEGHDETEIGWGSGRNRTRTAKRQSAYIHRCPTALFVLRYGRRSGRIVRSKPYSTLAVDPASNRGRSALQICIARFATAIAASFTTSDIVGWAWQVRARSSAEPPNSISTAASWIISPAPKPTM